MVYQAVLLIHNFSYLVLRLHWLLLYCYFVSHPPPCATLAVYYRFLTLFPFAYSVYEVLPRLFPVHYVRRVFRAVNKVGGFTGGGRVTHTDMVSMLNIV